MLWGEDEEHLQAVAAAVWDEVDRVERLLSRFDADSEVARVNRLAANNAVRVDAEPGAILQTCIDAQRWTNGFFDITANSRSRLSNILSPIVFDHAQRTVRFTQPGVTLDFGAVGKGYALDRAAAILRRYNVTSALLHGGTSSVIALGCQPGNVPWCVSMCDSDEFPLIDGALSVSATRHNGQHESDIIDPRTGEPLPGDAACAVVAHDAVTAEILSTACLAMGKRTVEEYIDHDLEHSVLINWLDKEELAPNWHWFI